MSDAQKVRQSRAMRRLGRAVRRALEQKGWTPPPEGPLLEPKGEPNLTPEFVPDPNLGGNDLPDIAIEIVQQSTDPTKSATGLSDSSVSAIQKVVNAIAGRPLFPHVARSLPGSVVFTRLGFWLTPDSGVDRDAVTANVDLLAFTSFGIWIGKTALDVIAQNRFTKMSKTYSKDGKPDPNGPITLQKISFDLEGPDQIVTTGSGVFSESGVSMGVTITLLDTLVANPEGPLQCDTSGFAQVDSGPAAALAVFVPFFFAYLLADAREVALGVYLREQVGVGCQLAGLLPSQILTQDETAPKVLLQYSLDPDVGPAGVLVGGNLVAVQRNPKVVISGPSALLLTTDDVFFDREQLHLFFQTQITDLDPTSTTYAWTATSPLGSPTIATPGAAATLIIFHLLGYQVGEVTFTVSVHAMDGNFSADDTKDVVVQIIKTPKLPTPKPNRPPLPRRIE